MLFNRFQRLINNRLLWYSVGHIMSTPQYMYLSPFYFMLHKDKKKHEIVEQQGRGGVIYAQIDLI